MKIFAVKLSVMTEPKSVITCVQGSKMGIAAGGNEDTLRNYGHICCGFMELFTDYNSTAHLEQCSLFYIDYTSVRCLGKKY